MEEEPLRIAPKRDGNYWTVEDWKKIDFSKEEGWQKAITIFKDRIDGRFLEIVDNVQKITFAGFSIMALECLLIETLQQFHEGVPETPPQQSREYFIRFLTRTSFGNYFDEAMAIKFYQDIRCGILHQAETKQNSRIWIRTGSPLVRWSDDGNGLIINRVKFHRQLVQEFEYYVKCLHSNDPPGLREKLRKKMDAICKVNENKPAIGILAYGSLLKKPGKELSRKITNLIRVETPFEVEYARTSKERAGAPTIVRVQDGRGKKVHAYILVLKDNLAVREAHSILYRREIDRVGEKTIVYDEGEQRKKKDGVIIRKLKNFGRVSIVLLADLKPNYDYALREDVSTEKKAEELARLAMDSLSKKTFNSGRDGIQYLDDATSFGIHTRLTPLYKGKILREADGAADLKEARLKIARSKGIG